MTGSDCAHKAAAFGKEVGRGDARAMRRGGGDAKVQPIYCAGNLLWTGSINSTLPPMLFQPSVPSRYQ